MSDNIKYYQTIPELGIVGRMNTPEEFDAIGLPKKLNRLTVLDIGCNIGAFIVEANKRKARWVDGVEPNIDWRLLAKGIMDELCIGATIYKDIDEIPEKALEQDWYDVVLLLSITHLVDNPQELIDKAWGLTNNGGLLIIEVNDRLQGKEVKLPKEAKLYGKNKDNRSVYHCVKNSS